MEPQRTSQLSTINSPTINLFVRCLKELIEVELMVDGAADDSATINHQLPTHQPLCSVLTVTRMRTRMFALRFGFRTTSLWIACPTCAV